jgi:hypothetical protein
MRLLLNNPGFVYFIFSHNQRRTFSQTLISPKSDFSIKAGERWNMWVTSFFSNTWFSLEINRIKNQIDFKIIKFIYIK